MVEGRVLGTGVDLVENERIADVMQRWDRRFADRVFLPEEQRYCRGKAFPFMHLAARFAVKEAVSKAFGTGFGPSIGWLDIEVVRNEETGAPSVRLRGKAEELARANGVGQVLVSLAHTRKYSVATALLIAQ
jgi:holo-[acyl-carrier protein] synthase